MSTEITSQSDSTKLVTKLTLINKHGIHVRTAAKISELCETFASDVLISSPSATSDATDMMRLLLLQAGVGTELTIEVSGNDAEHALQSLSSLINSGFNIPEERLD